MEKLGHTVTNVWNIKQYKTKLPLLREDWYEILLETVQNFYKSIQRRLVTVLRAKGTPRPY
jgi:hypothetical protein